MKNIILIGMPGSGKTTIGKILAKELDRKFFDTDKVFETTVCPDIKEYFAHHGEADFRSAETNILKTLCAEDGCIISTGGGVIEIPQNKEILQNGGIVVFIDRDPDDIVKDIDTESRPVLLAQGKQRIYSLYESRYEKYKNFCHVRVPNIGTLDDLTKKIINEVNKYND